MTKEMLQGNEIQDDTGESNAENEHGGVNAQITDGPVEEDSPDDKEGTGKQEAGGTLFKGEGKKMHREGLLFFHQLVQEVIVDGRDGSDLEFSEDFDEVVGKNEGCFKMSVDESEFWKRSRQMVTALAKVGCWMYNQSPKFVGNKLNQGLLQPCRRNAKNLAQSIFKWKKSGKEIVLTF